MSKKIVIIGGPTASGKTRLSIELAKALDGEIISCDSMQLYKFMDIGSAKPNKEELSQVPHHLIGCVDPREDFSVAKYKALADEAIDKVMEKGKLPILVGGTGLYINSFVYHMDFSLKPVGESSQIRKEMYELAEASGREAVYNILEELDPNRAKAIHPNNLQKVVRAIEVAKLGGTIGDFSKDLKKSCQYDSSLIIVNRNRQQLYDRINQRVDLMMEDGLVEEVKGLLDLGLTEEHISMKAIGYKEIIAYLKGQCSLNDAVDKVKQNSRHLAKRQITWFKKYEDALWVNLTDLSEADAITAAEKFIEEKK